MESELKLFDKGFKGFSAEDCAIFRAKLFNWRVNYLEFVMAEAGNVSPRDDPGTDLINDIEDRDVSNKDGKISAIKILI